jgi:hypothetical protein
MMSDDFPSPDGHAQGWYLVSRQALGDRTWIDASDMTPALLLLRDCAGEWWALAPSVTTEVMLRSNRRRRGRLRLSAIFYWVIGLLDNGRFIATGTLA